MLYFRDPPTTEIYTLSLHDALPICRVPILAEPRRERPSEELGRPGDAPVLRAADELAHHLLERELEARRLEPVRSEEHTSELQSHVNLVCRLLLEKKKKQQIRTHLL